MKCTPEMCPPDCCDMRGMLSFMILWLLQKKPMYGDEIAQELGKSREWVSRAYRKEALALAGTQFIKLISAADPKINV